MDQLPTPKCIVAYVGEHNRFRAARDAAIDMAGGAKARVILYDLDAEALFSSPVPTDWASEGTPDQFGDLLRPDQLEHLGRHELALILASAHERGVDAYAHLPKKHGVDPLAEFCRRHKADLIVVPAELEKPGLDKRLWGETLDKIEKATQLPIAVVEQDGTTRFRVRGVETAVGSR